jgi:AraC-like DNA-binding protein
MGMEPKRWEEGFRVSTAVLSQLLRYAEHLGIEPMELIRSAGVDALAARSPDSQLAVADYIAIENAAVLASGDPCFGLHMGEFGEAGNYSILGYLMMNSATLGEAMALAGKYYRVLGNLIEPSWQLGFKRVKVILAAPAHGPAFSRHCFEAAFATQVTMMRKITGRSINPCEVGFTGETLAGVAEYERVFACPVKFGQKRNYIILENAWGKIPVLQPSPEMLAHFKTYADRLVARLDEGKTLRQEVTMAILARLPSGRAGVADVARAMAVSVRTLQNRLKGEGWDYSGLLNQTRAELSRRYVEEGRTVEEMTCLLGYSEPSAFRKAFKKWHGTTPCDLRDRLRKGT